MFGFLFFLSWHAIIVDGHSVEELCKVLGQPRYQPLAVIAKTIKGKGIPGKTICVDIQTVFKLEIATHTMTFPLLANLLQNLNRDS